MIFMDAKLNGFMHSWCMIAQRVDNRMPGMRAFFNLIQRRKIISLSECAAGCSICGYDKRDNFVCKQCSPGYIYNTSPCSKCPQGKCYKGRPNYCSVITVLDAKVYLYVSPISSPCSKCPVQNNHYLTDCFICADNTLKIKHHIHKPTVESLCCLRL